MATRADGTVIIDITADPKQAINSINNVEKSVNGLASAAKKLTGILVAAFAVDKIVQFGKEAIELGSDVAEVQNVVDVAFGDMSYMVEDFADKAITSFGMSELAAKRTASTYMAMASNMGVTQRQAAEMAITLAGLTGDVASFYNISQELADIKLRSVFTGETETLKDLGIVMTQANLEAYALANGINRSFQSMSQSEQLILRYNYVLDQLSLASGDFVRTQDSWANQTRILSMQWQEFMSIIGQALIQVLLPVIRVLNQIVSSLIDIANAFNAAISAIFGGATTQVQQTQAAVGGVSAGIDEAVDNQNALTDATKETNKEQQKSLATFDEINTLSSGAGGSGGSGGAGAGGVGLSQFTPITSENIIESGAENKILDFIERLKNAFQPFEDSFNRAFANISAGANRLVDVFRDIWNDIRSLGSPLYDWFTNEFTAFLNQFILTVGTIVGGLLDSVAMVLSDLWNHLLLPALQQFITAILPALTEWSTQFLMTVELLFTEVKALFDQIWKDAFVPFLDLLADIWTGLWEGWLNVWNEYGEEIFSKIREAISNTFDTLQNIWETIVAPIWQTFMDTLDELWNEHFQPLWENMVEFVTLLGELAITIYNNFILPIVNWFVDTFGPGISEAISFVIEVLGGFLGTAADVANVVLEAINGVLKFLIDVFEGDWDSAWQRISDGFKGIWNGIVGALEGAINLIIRGVNWLISQLNKVSFSVPDWVPAIGGKSFGFNIPKISEVAIPRLAQGAVIPPNREFMAVLGDQTRGNNIEAPEDLIRRIVREESGGMNTELLQQILAAIRAGQVIKVNETVLGRTSAKAINKITRSSGKSVLLY